jgi:hypothetical protein
MMTCDTSKYLPQVGFRPKRIRSDEAANLSAAPFRFFRAEMLSRPQSLNPSDNIENYHEEVQNLRCSCNRDNDGRTRSTHCVLNDRFGGCDDISADACGDAIARTRRRRTAVLRDARRIQWSR